MADKRAHELAAMAASDAATAGNLAVVATSAGLLKSSRFDVLMGALSRLHKVAIVTDPVFGAVGDGTTDDTASIQAAIDYAELSGASVYLPKGTYLVTAPLIFDVANTRFYGDGDASVLKRGWNGGNFFEIAASYLQFYDFLFDWNSKTGDGVQIFGGHYQRFENVNTDNASGKVLYFANDVAQVSKVVHCRWSTTQPYAYQITGTDASANHRKLLGCDFGTSYVDIGGAQTTFITSCQMQQLFMSSGSKKLIMTGGRITNGGVSALTVSGIDHTFDGVLTAHSVTLDASTANVNWRSTSTGVTDNGTSSTDPNTILDNHVARTTRLAPKRVVLTYSASMTPNATLGTSHTITATNGTAFTINAPTNTIAYDGQSLTITIRNTSGGALGVATWDAVFKMATWTQPATGFSRSIAFEYNGTNWVERSRTTADVPN